MDKIDCFYASLQVDFKIEYYLELNKYLGIYLDRCPDGSIYLRQHYITQSIINLIPGMENSSDKPNPVVKPHLQKNRDINPKK